MTSSTRYGSSDRRKHMRTEEIRVKNAIREVYETHGYREQTKPKNDPETVFMMEQESRKRALAHLPVKDRTVMNACVQRMKECVPGCGDGSALQILMHIGILLNLGSR